MGFGTEVIVRVEVVRVVVVVSIAVAFVSGFGSCMGRG